MTRTTGIASLLAGVAATAAVAAAATGTTPWRAHQSSLRTISSSGQVTVADSGGRQGSLRVRYILPTTWQRVGALNARTLRFATHNSCRHVVTVTPRLVQAADVPPADRAAALTTGAVQRAYGSREGAAFRVGRVRGTANVLGVVVQPLSTRFTPGVPAGQRIYAEILATAKPDPKLECHSGGPRRVEDALGDSFAAADAVGGFVFATG